MGEGHEENYIEPQVIKASQVMVGKGYRIGTLAGSAGSPEEGKQAIVFEYPKAQPSQNPFEEEVMRKLKSLGVSQYSGAMPVGTIGLEFNFDSKDSAGLERKWMEVAEALPEVKP